ncbi:hypothetical protein [Nocardioides sp.]
MYSRDMIAAEVSYRTDRARNSYGARRRMRIRKPLVHRPADSVTDSH